MSLLFVVVGCWLLLAVCCFALLYWEHILVVIETHITSFSVAKSFSTEERVRKKHRMHHQKKKLKAVRKNFARRYSQILTPISVNDEGSDGFVQDDSWSREFNVEGSYESPFLGTTHSTRNVTVLSPIKDLNKQ